MHDEPSGVPQDEGGDEVPVDDVPQAADAPMRQMEEETLSPMMFLLLLNVSSAGLTPK